MTPNEAKEILSSTDLSRGSKHNVMRGLQILAETNPFYNGEICAEHDQIFAADFEKTVKNMTAEQVAEMGSLGWLESDGTWMKYV